MTNSRTIVVGATPAQQIYQTIATDGGQLYLQSLEDPAVSREVVTFGVRCSDQYTLGHVVDVRLGPGESVFIDVSGRVEVTASSSVNQSIVTVRHAKTRHDTIPPAVGEDSGVGFLAYVAIGPNNGWAPPFMRWLTLAVSNRYDVMLQDSSGVNIAQVLNSVSSTNIEPRGLLLPPGFRFAIKGDTTTIGYVATWTQWETR